MHAKTTAMATTGRRSSQEQLSTSRSRRHFHWSSSKVTTSEEDSMEADTDELQRIKIHLQNQQREEDIAQISKSKNPNSTSEPPQRRKLPAIAVSRIKSVLITAFSGTGAGHIGRSPHTPRGLGPKVIGTLFGHRRGHVNVVFQREHNSSPVFFVELATPITTLVKEMASGLVRIALECDKPDHHQQQHQEETKNANKSTVSAAGKLRARSRATWGGASSNSKRLLEEPVWRAFCNGKKCGFANKREPGPRELKVLKTVEPISMGAGVLPGFDGAGLSGSDGEMMYMRAKFERVVGSRDSEAFYMMNPDCDGAPELSLYLLRV